MQYTHSAIDGLFGSAAFALPDGRQFPSVFWRTASPQEIADLGFVEFVPEPPTLEDLRTAKIAAINSRSSDILAAGAPIVVDTDTLHVALDDGSRADMTAMGTTAIAAASSAVPWPDSYQAGWITVENIRIPLPLPSDGLALAATVGDYYAQIKRHARDLKDAAIAAEDQSALDAIDIEMGWPT